MSRFNVLTGKKPTQEFVKTGMPDFCKLYIHHSDDDIIYGTDE